jgi:hypothetical protein
MTPLHLAVSECESQLEITALLISARADVHACGQYEAIEDVLCRE